MATNPNEQFKFSGFDLPEQNWFKLPNNWTDLTAGMKTWAEHKVVEYVLRHTWGYQEYGVLKRITLDEFMNGRKRADGTRLDKGVGMGKKAIIDGIRQAIVDGFLIEEVDDSDKGRTKKSYGIRMRLDRGSMIEPQMFDDRTPDVRSSYSRGSENDPRTEKDTIEKNIERNYKKKDNNNSGVPPENEDVVVALLNLGISKSVAQRLASRYNRDRILEKIDFLEYLQETDPKKVTNPRGWLRRAIEENYGKPDGYKSRAEREAEASAAEQRRQAQMEQDALRVAQEAEKQQQEALTREEQLKPLREHYSTSENEKSLWAEWVSHIGATNPMGASVLQTSSELLSASQERVVIWVANDYLRQQLLSRYAKTIRQLAARQFKIPLTQVNLEVLTTEGQPNDEG